MIEIFDPPMQPFYCDTIAMSRKIYKSIPVVVAVKCMLSAFKQQLSTMAYSKQSSLAIREIALPRERRSLVKARNNVEWKASDIMWATVALNIMHVFYS